MRMIWAVAAASLFAVGARADDLAQDKVNACLDHTTVMCSLDLALTITRGSADAEVGRATAIEAAALRLPVDRREAFIAAFRDQGSEVEKALLQRAIGRARALKAVLAGDFEAAAGATLTHPKKPEWWYQDLEAVLTELAMTGKAKEAIAFEEKVRRSATFAVEDPFGRKMQNADGSERTITLETRTALARALLGCNCQDAMVAIEAVPARQDRLELAMRYYIDKGDPSGLAGYLEAQHKADPADKAVAGSWSQALPALAAIDTRYVAPFADRMAAAVKAGAVPKDQIYPEDVDETLAAAINQGDADAAKALIRLAGPNVGENLSYTVITDLDGPAKVAPLLVKAAQDAVYTGLGHLALTEKRVKEALGYLEKGGFLAGLAAAKGDVTEDPADFEEFFGTLGAAGGVKEGRDLLKRVKNAKARQLFEKALTSPPASAAAQTETASREAIIAAARGGGPAAKGFRLDEDLGTAREEGDATLMLAAALNQHKLLMAQDPAARRANDAALGTLLLENASVLPNALPFD